MSDLVGNPEDRFSHNEAHIFCTFLISARNKKEIEFLQGAFESYKSSLHQEMDDKWNRKKTDLTNELEQQKDKEIHEMSMLYISVLLILLEILQSNTHKLGLIFICNKSMPIKGYKHCNLLYFEQNLEKESMEFHQNLYLH